MRIILYSMEFYAKKKSSFIERYSEENIIELR